MPLVLAFLVTLVPFYHGTLRHLDDTYRSSIGPMPGRRLLWDYGFLFAEGGVLVLVAFSVERLRLFCWCVLALLLVDIAWESGARFVRGQAANDTHQWALINMGAAPTVGIMLVAAYAGVAGVFLCWLVLLIAVVRSAVDYYLYFPFYIGA